MHTRTTSLRRQMPAVLLAALLLALPLLTPTPAWAAESSVDADAEATFVRNINEERTSRGLPALAVADDLTAVARTHSGDMAHQQDLHHNPDLADDVTGWKRLAENVGVGHSVSSLHQAFMDSDGHRANILNRHVTQIGVGVQVEDNGRMWVTEVFRQPAEQRLPPGGTPLWGDWNGDGTPTPGRHVGNTFYLAEHADGTGRIRQLHYGHNTDTPVTGDWNGDGRDTIGVVRGNKFILRNHYYSGADDIVLHYGRDTDTPVVGDWDGNGTDTLGVVRGNKFILRNEYRSGADDIVLHYGRDTDTPLVGDWNGDGTDTIGVVRGNEFILRYEYRRGADIVLHYGTDTDIPVVGDWNGDGTDTLGVVRDDTWILRYVYRSGADIVFDY